MSIAKNPLSLLLTLSFIAGLHARPSEARSQPIPKPQPYIAQASEVTAYLVRTFLDEKRGVFVKAANDRTPDYIWREAAAFAALAAAARHDPAYRPLLDRVFKSLDIYWDTQTAIPAYEPAPTRGNGHDKYYDDNAWLVIAFLEAYELTGEEPYLTRAREVARFVDSGWDDQLGGGIWWHQSHKDGSKNACSNGPAAVGYLRLAQLGPKSDAERWIAAARKAVEWTQARLQAKDGLYEDHVIVATGEVKRGKLTYNSALMLRAELDLYRQSGRPEYLEEAQRIGKSADWFLDSHTGVYRDPLKWSQFMVEADLDLYRQTREPYLLSRAQHNVDAYFARWKQAPPADMMSNAAIARMLWLLADAEQPRKKSDNQRKK